MRVHEASPNDSHSGWVEMASPSPFVIFLISKDIEYLLKYLPTVSFESCLFRSRVHFVFLWFLAPWCYAFELFACSRQYSSTKCIVGKTFLPLFGGLSCSLIYCLSDCPSASWGHICRWLALFPEWSESIQIVLTYSYIFYTEVSFIFIISKLLMFYILNIICFMQDVFTVTNITNLLFCPLFLEMLELSIYI